MGKHPRLNIPGATYHVMARGNRKCTIFEDVRDRHRFLTILAEATLRYGVSVHADCQMGNHFHLVVTTPHANLPEFMRQVDGCYTQYSNWRHGRVGHLFQGPYKAILIEYDSYLIVAVGYVVMNPVDAGLVSHPRLWRWSSYRATCGLGGVPPHLSIDFVDSVFPAPTRADSQRLFSEFIDGGHAPDDWPASPAVGSERFRKAVRSFIGENLHRASLPRAYRALFRPSLSELFTPSITKAERPRVVERAHIVHGYTMSEIARALRMHPASISRVICKLRGDGERRLRNVQH